MRKVIALLSLVGGMLFTPVAAYAVGSSGFELGTNSTRAMAKANAVVADPEDPSTVAFNPAGLTELQGNQISFSATAISPVHQHTGVSGGLDEDASVPVVPIPAVFFSLSTPIERMKLGGGVNAPFGLQTHYDSEGAFRYSGYYNEIITTSYNLAAAYEFSDWFSVGGGWSYVELDLKQVGKLNSNFITASVIPGFSGLPDSEFELDVEGHGVGWNIGFLITPSPQHSLGVFYKSSVPIECRGVFDVDGIAGPVMTAIFAGTNFHTSSDTDVTLPDSLTLGYRYSPSDRWDIEVDFAWTNWSVFDQVDIAFGSSNAVIDQFEPVREDFNDTISIQVGTSYDINQNWTLMGGYFFFEMAAGKESYSNVIPDGDRHGFAFGVQFNQKSFSVDVGYIAEIFDEVNIDNEVGLANGTSVDGDYSGLIHILSVGVTTRF